MGIFIIAGAVLVGVMAIGIFLASRYTLIEPSQRGILIGGKRGELKVLPSGAGFFLMPIIRKLSIVELRQYQVTVDTECIDNQSVRLKVRSTVFFKVDDSDTATIAAAQRFANSDVSFSEAIETFMENNISGSIRQVIGAMLVSDLLTNREKLSAEVNDTVATEVAKMGISIDSFQIDSIEDENNYIENLGRPALAEAKAKAEIAEAQQFAKAEEVKLAKKLEVAEKTTQTAIREAELKAERDQQSEIANAAAGLEKARQDKLIAQEQAITAEAEAARIAKELEGTVNKPAEAEKYQRQQEADAAKYEQEREAEAARYAREQAAEAELIESRKQAEAAQARGEAEAAVTKAKGESEAGVISAKGQAEADSVKAKGLAEAESVKAKGLAEAEALNKRADAYEKFGEAAQMQILFDAMPKVVEAAAKPMGNINELNVISTEGASGITKEVYKSVAQFSPMLESLLGKGISDIIGGSSKANG